MLSTSEPYDDSADVTAAWRKATGETVDDVEARFRSGQLVLLVINDGSTRLTDRGGAVLAMGWEAVRDIEALIKEQGQ